MAIRNCGDGEASVAYKRTVRIDDRALAVSFSVCACGCTCALYDRVDVSTLLGQVTGIVFRQGRSYWRACRSAGAWDGVVLDRCIYSITYYSEIRWQHSISFIEFYSLGDICLSCENSQFFLESSERTVLNHPTIRNTLTSKCWHISFYC